METQVCHLSVVSTYGTFRLESVLEKSNPPCRGARFEVALVAFLTIEELSRLYTARRRAI